MRPRSPSTEREDAPADAGSAALEFIVVGLLLLVPLVYLIVALGAIQAQALGVESGARHIARALAGAPDPAVADARARAVLETTIAEYGLDAGATEIAVTCRQPTRSCPAAGATVVVTVATRVSLPLVPPVLGLDRITSVPIDASAVQKVSRFWSGG